MIAERKRISKTSPLITLEDLKVFYTAKKGTFSLKKEYIKAVNGVSLELYEGETLGLVGESGCGKSTLGKSIIGLEKITDGKINFNGEPLDYKTDRVSLSKQIQIVFQDPYSTLNPRMTIGKLLKEPLIVHRIVPKKMVDREVERLLELVGLPLGAKNLHPHEFSGGQRQRIGIARALSLKPKLIICDEPVSALDVSIQAQIMNLFKKLRKELGLTYLFIAHGLGAIKYISDRIAVMYEGKIVETGTTKEIFLNPQHDYTKLLLSAYPTPDPRKRKIMSE